MNGHTRITSCAVSLMATAWLSSCQMFEPPQEEGPWQHIFAHMDDYTADAHEEEILVTPLNPEARPCVDSGLSAPGCN